MRERFVSSVSALLFLAACGSSTAPGDAPRGLDAEPVCRTEAPVCVQGTECASPGCVGDEMWQCPLGFTPRPAGSVTCAPSCPADLVAAEGTACAEEGRSCGTCLDPCGFCNTLRCQGGLWTRLEAPPPPDPCVSFVCGERRCDAVTQYCERTLSDIGGLPDSYACVPYPPGCMACACLPTSSCEGDAATGITVTSGGG
jgi:hypothetical protein